ncbi:MAG TPA: lipoate--protein ligase family protein [Candidatus Acidoferrales bacterium]|nr:lipoate--protein ligase family protein [Candidatus Acidoferrales bacterium]
MDYLDLSLPTPAENLACDEALLEECDEGDGKEVLRFWEPSSFFVVLGYSSRIGSEINAKACREAGIPILRRSSGGGTVVQGPGCLNYALVLRITECGPAQSITETNAFVLHRVRDALSPLVEGRVEIQGTSDLAIAGRKFCGNAQRRKKNALLFHGVFLLGMDLDLIERCLALPAKQPAYRAGRAHKDFLVNLNIPAPPLKRALRAAWHAERERAQVPRARVERLVENQYATEEWLRKF